MITFNKILIANRGEIAIRIIRTAKKLGIHTVAIYSVSDADSLHVSKADEAYFIGSDNLAESYINIEKIINIAKAAKADAIHPGYGFLSENPSFAKACEMSGITFIGPSYDSIFLMGNKIESRKIAERIGVPLINGISGSPDEIIENAHKIGFPVLVKAAAGGGGKGMKVVEDESNLLDALLSTSREAKSYFGDGTVYIEKYFSNPRHIEVQVLGDKFGNIIHINERECTIQRRHQKIIEESPSPTLTPEIRSRMFECAIKLAEEIHYFSAGTIEFLVDEYLNFYFLEMNTRIQVEHPVTEMTTGIDLVEEQIYIAAGNKLRFAQNDIKTIGHAIECRIYAEDPSKNFQPSPGKISYLYFPSGKDIRLDSGINKPSEVYSFFDPMIAKLIAYGFDRDSARNKLSSALQHFVIHGISTNIEYLDNVILNKDFAENKISTRFCIENAELIKNNTISSKNEIPAHLPISAFLIDNIIVKKTDDNIWNTIGYWRNQMNINIISEDNNYNIRILNIENNKILFSNQNETYLTFLKKYAGGRLEFTVNEHHLIAYISRKNNNSSFISFFGKTFEFSRKDELSNQEDFPPENILLSSKKGKITSPMPGKIIKINVISGQEIRKNDCLLIVEAMKMENNILASTDGIIENIYVKQNEMVDSTMELLTIKSLENE